MANLIAQNVSVSGTALSLVAASAGGDSFANSGGVHTLLHVKNGGVTPCNVTIASPTQCSQGFTHNIVVPVAAGAEQIIGPFSSDRFNDANGNVNITYDQVASVTIGVIKN